MSRFKDGAKSAWYTVFSKSPRTYVSRYLKQVALNAYHRKLAVNQDYRDWASDVGEKRVREHWARSEVTDPFAIAQLTSQIYELTRHIGLRVAQAGGRGTVLDAGASDAMFLAGAAPEGVGLNILMPCARKVRDEGYTACLGDLENLPFRVRSFDYVICCETLEHLMNPVRGLCELARICRRRMFLTIPWLPQGSTRITARFTEHADDQHVFEFSRSDFEKIVTHTDLKIVHTADIEVFPERYVGPVDRVLLRKFIYPSYFPRLQYFELEVR